MNLFNMLSIVLFFVVTLGTFMCGVVLMFRRKQVDRDSLSTIRIIKELEMIESLNEKHNKS